MDKVLKTGQYFFAFACLVFGIQHFMYAGFVATLVPTWVPFHLFWAYFVGFVFIICAVSIALNRNLYVAFMVVGIMITIFILLIHVPKLLGNAGGGGDITNACKDLAIAGGALAIARNCRKNP